MENEEFHRKVLIQLTENSTLLGVLKEQSEDRYLEFKRILRDSIQGLDQDLKDLSGKVEDHIHGPGSKDNRTSTRLWGIMQGMGWTLGFGAIVISIVVMVVK